MELLQHLVSNDHGEWNVIVGFVQDQFPVMSMWVRNVLIWRKR